MTEIPSFGLAYKYGSHQGPSAPAFCRGCGAPMRIGRRSRGYNQTTGEQEWERTATCSRSFLLRSLSFWQMHDHAVEDFHGDWPWL